MSCLKSFGLRLLKIALSAWPILTACGNHQSPVFQGYVEGEYLYLAAPQAGYLKSLDVLRGSRVTAAQQIFSVEADPDIQALEEAEAKTKAAKEKVQNLREPHRQPEIAALEAQVRAVDSALHLAETQLAQQEVLARRHFVSQSRLDEAKANRDRNAAELDAAKQQLATYRTTLGRQAEVRGAEADMQAAAAQAAQKRWQVERKTIAASVAGQITDTYYRPGEWVPAGSPVATLLPDSQRRIRFFVPETALATLTLGQAVDARCDSCASPIRATINFISPQSEYTPPVIYSRGSREKLVFRVEATPVPEQINQLHPGLPVDVSLPGH